MATIYATVGLPYSGKTTWALAQGLPIVSPDAIRLAMHGERFLGPAEPWVWTMAHTMLEALVAAGHGEIIVDATNVKPRRRLDWTDAHPGHEFQWVVPYANHRTCLDRARAADDHAILPIIDRQAAEFDISGLPADTTYIVETMEEQANG